jgi:hypothetical protein
MNFYEINREERHFGFLLMAAIISNSEFRRRFFNVINFKRMLSLDPDDFEIYAEVALFRDLWYDLGDQKDYNNTLHEKRLAMLKKLFDAIQIDEQMIFKFEIFWTKEIGNSKLWFPGKWPQDKMVEIEKHQQIEKHKLKRCRWLCNAKPDVLIQSNNSFVFIEIKVESGMGSNEEGYNQEETQNDIILVASKLVEFVGESKIKRINLTNKKAENELSWEEVKQFHSESKIENDLGFEMIERHFKYMPVSQI